MFDITSILHRNGHILEWLRVISASFVKEVYYHLQLRYRFLKFQPFGDGFIMDNIQRIADAVQKGLQLIVRASVQQGSTRLRRLRIELCSDSFHAVLALSCGRA